MSEWLPIESVPKTERNPIWLKIEGMEPQAAFSDTFWRGGFSAGCTPTHWKRRQLVTESDAPLFTTPRT